MSGKITKYLSVKQILDIIVVILNLTYHLSILGCVTIDYIPVRFAYLRLVLPLFVIYLFRFGAKFPFTSHIILRSRYLTLWLFFFFFEAFQASIVSGTFGFFLNIVYYLLMWEYLYGMFRENNRTSCYDRVCAPLECYTVYNCIVIFVAALLIFTGVLDAFDNPVSDVFSVFKDNHEVNNTEYYFPGYLSVSTSYFHLLSFLGIPLLEGLSYEPHVLNYTIIPAWFLLQSSINNKAPIFKYISYFLLFSTICISTSATAVMCLFATIFFEVLWYGLKKGNIRPLIIIIIIIIVASIFLSQFYDALKEYMALKIGKDDGSREYSESSLNYILSASGLFGKGIVNPHAGFELIGDNIGFLSSFLIICLYIITVIKSIKLGFSSDINKHYIGLACLYFWMHSLKLGVQAFSFPYFIFFIFIMSISEDLKFFKIQKNKG